MIWKILLALSLAGNVGLGWVLSKPKGRDYIPRPDELDQKLQEGWKVKSVNLRRVGTTDIPFYVLTRDD